MVFSQDEFEDHPPSMSRYHFVDERKVLVSFFILPTQWSESENTDSKNEQVLLHGVADNGCRR